MLRRRRLCTPVCTPGHVLCPASHAMPGRRRAQEGERMNAASLYAGGRQRRF
jgi:hypothetical protein